MKYSFLLFKKILIIFLKIYVQRTITQKIILFFTKINQLSKMKYFKIKKMNLKKFNQIKAFIFPLFQFPIVNSKIVKKVIYKNKKYIFSYK